jgi:hypothetical protein
MAKKEFTVIFILAFLIAVLHFIATEFYIYWHYWWFDILMHFLGGLLISLIFLWIAYLSGYVGRTQRKKSHTFILALGSSLIIGLGWELFEYMTGLTFVLSFEDYRLDTLLDLCMDIAGGLAGYLYYVAKIDHE